MAASFFAALSLRSIMFEGLFQPMHLLIIAGIALLVFGPKKLPELGKGLGDGSSRFQSGDERRELRQQM